MAWEGREGRIFRRRPEEHAGDEVEHRVAGRGRDEEAGEQRPGQEGIGCRPGYQDREESDPAASSRQQQGTETADPRPQATGDHRYNRADKGIPSHRWGWLKDTDQSISEGALFRFISRFGSHLGGLLVELAEELDPWAVVCPYARSFAPRLIAIRSSWFNMLKASTTAQSSASSASLFNSTTTVLQACPMSGLPTGNILSNDLKARTSSSVRVTVC